MPANNPLKILNRAKKMLWGENGYEYASPDDKTIVLMTNALISYVNNDQVKYNTGLIYKIIEQYKITNISSDTSTKIYQIYEKAILEKAQLKCDVYHSDIYEKLIEKNQINYDDQGDKKNIK